MVPQILAAYFLMKLLRLVWAQTRRLNDGSKWLVLRLVPYQMDGRSFFMRYAEGGMREGCIRYPALHEGDKTKARWSGYH